MSSIAAIPSAEPFVVASVHELAACRATAVSLRRLAGPRLEVELVDAELDLEDELWKVSGSRSGAEHHMSAVLSRLCSPRELARRLTPSVVASAVEAGRVLAVLEAGSFVLGALDRMLQSEEAIRVAAVPPHVPPPSANLPVWVAGRSATAWLGALAELYETRLAHPVDVVRDVALTAATLGGGRRWPNDDSAVQVASLTDLRSSDLDIEAREFHIGGAALSVVGPGLPVDEALSLATDRREEGGDAYAALLRVCLEVQGQAQRDIAAQGLHVPAAPTRDRAARMSPALAVGVRQLLGEQPSLLADWRELRDAKAAEAALARWLGRPAARTSSVVTNAAAGLWRGRPDLQTHFPDPVLADSDRFLTWLATQGVTEEAMQPSWCDLRTTFPARPGIPADVSSRSQEIVLIGHLDSSLGVGLAARHLRRGLRDAGHAVRSVAVSPEGSIPPNQAADLAQTDPGLCIWAVNPPECLSVMASLADLWARTARNVAYWWWEVAWLPPVFPQCAAVLDEVWASTAFVQDCLADLAPMPVLRAPLYLSPELRVSAMSRAELGWPGDRTVYLARADFHSSPARKNPEGVLRAYLQAFPSSEHSDALLVLKVENAAADPVSFDRLRLLKGARRDVMLMTGRLSEPDNNAVTASADVYVSLHRSEGLGLPIAEAMATRTAVIATNFGGSTELVSGDSAALVPARLVPVMDPSGTYGGGSWAEPDLATAAEAMRLLCYDHAARDRLAEAGHARLARLGDPEALGRFVHDRLAAGGRRERPRRRLMTRATRGRAR